MSIYAKFIVTDSRGITTTKEKLVNIYDWFEPEALITLERKTSNTGSITVNANYALIGGHNTLTINGYIKKTSESEFTSIGAITSDVEKTFSVNENYDYDVKVELIDALSSTTIYYFVLPRYTPLMYFDANKYSVGVNCFPNNSGTLTLCGDVVVNGTYRLNNDIIIKGETGNETITYNGPITNNKSLALMVNAFANGTNNYSVSRFNIGKNKTFTINGATTITSNVNIDSTGMINVADDATLTFSGNTTFNTSTTINGNGNVYFNAYVKAQGAKLTTYPTVTLADVGSNMLIDTIEVKGGTFNYNRSNTDYNQRPIRSLIVDGGTFALNIPNWASMNLTGAAILKSGTLQMAAGKTLKLTNTDCDTLNHSYSVPLQR